MSGLEVLTNILSYLHPQSYAAMSLVCTKFNALVKTPYAWKTAFHRMYSTRSLLNGDEFDDIWEDDGDVVNPTHSRYFSRLTGKATWQSEYVLRSQLLRGLASGRPCTRVVNDAGEAVRRSNAVITYDSRVPCLVTNVYADFPGDKLPAKAIHGSADLGVASMSNPMTGTLDPWARYDTYTLGRVDDFTPHLALYGVEEGPAVVPNVMDVSPKYGFIAGEGFPGGHPYFRPSVGKRGRVIDYGTPLPDTYPDVPQLPRDVEATSSVWIAKTSAVPLLTKAMVGMMTGSTLGIVTAYALGRQTGRRRFEDGEMSCRWVLCPGVPIVSIKVDEKYSRSRQAAGRIWAVALNALGEVYYLKDTPSPVGQHAIGPEMTHNAYLAGRTAYWHLIEPTRRTARSPSADEDPSPRSSANFMGLDSNDWLDEARAISQWLLRRPASFRARYRGWDMRRRLEVDFAADDGRGAGEAVFVIDSGHAEDVPAGMQRYSRFISNDTANGFEPSSVGAPCKADSWHCTPAMLGDVSFLKVTSSAMDMSTCASITLSEDPLVGDNKASFALGSSETSALDGIPGERARFIALGTDKGSITVWNARDPNTTRISPIKVIHTESPEISCLGLTSLYVVHGGSDGLVQAWDPLALTRGPIRTINTRSGSRIPRHLSQVNPGHRHQQYAAATSICMDPDATKLRGVVSFGAFIRSWSYCSEARPRGSGKKGKMDKETALESSDLLELRERNSQLQEKFGSGELDLTEEESLVYALMMSEESMVQDEVRRSEAVEALLLSHETAEPAPASGEGSEASASINIDELSAQAPASSDSFAADFYGGGDPFVEDVYGQDVPSTSQGEFGFAITYKKKGKKSKKGGWSRPGPAS